MYRPEIGVTSFLGGSSLKPWPCMFKHYYADFVVQEILNDGKVCEFTAEKQIYIPSDNEEEVAPQIPEKLNEQCRTELEEFRKNTEGKFQIDVNDWTKDERRQLHEYIRSVGGLDSSTNGNEITVIRLTRERKRRKPIALDKKYVHFTLAKENHDTSFCLNLIGRLLNKHSSSFGFCGTKDRRAVTAQRVSAHGTNPLTLYNLNSQLRGIKISDASYHAEDLSLGQLWGNRFSIVLRDFAQDETDPEFKQRMDAWIENGFLNYYGDQRFGSWEGITAKVGQKILQEDWEAAVNLILSRTLDFQDRMNTVLAYYRQTKDPKEAFKMLTGAQRTTSNEGKMLGALSKRPRDFKGALMSIARQSRTLYAHAYQSLVFNKVIARRVEKYGKQVLDGDLFMVGDEFKDTGTLEDVVLPLPCYPSRYPDNEIRQWYDEFLEEDGIKKEAYVSLQHEFGLYETFRKFVERPRNVSYEVVWYQEDAPTLQHFPPFCTRDESKISKTPVEGAKKALILRFDLPAGTYATMALRELLHVDLSRETQRELRKLATTQAPTADSENVAAEEGTAVAGEDGIKKEEILAVGQ